MTDPQIPFHCKLKLERMLTGTQFNVFVNDVSAGSIPASMPMDFPSPPVPSLEVPATINLTDHCVQGDNFILITGFNENSEGYRDEPNFPSIKAWFQGRVETTGMRVQYFEYRENSPTMGMVFSYLIWVYRRDVPRPQQELPAPIPNYPRIFGAWFRGLFPAIYHPSRCLSSNCTTPNCDGGSACTGAGTEAGTTGRQS